MQGKAEEEVRALYRDLLDCWDRQDAAAYAALFAEDGSVVGFDGSMMNGREEIAGTLGTIFAHHPTPTYVSIAREVRSLGPDVRLLRAVAGMVPRDKSEIDPTLNVVQSLLAVKQEGAWRVALFQNTPAAFHGRPEESEKLTGELRGLVQSQH